MFQVIGILTVRMQFARRRFYRTLHYSLPGCGNIHGTLIYNNHIFPVRDFVVNVNV